jgi:hypothetical protein
MAARALEVEAGGVHEHEIERAEEIAPPREQGLLDDVFEAARGEGRGAVQLILTQTAESSPVETGLGKKTRVAGFLVCLTAITDRSGSPRASSRRCRRCTTYRITDTLRTEWPDGPVIWGMSAERNKHYGAAGSGPVSRID